MKKGYLGEAKAKQGAQENNLKIIINILRSISQRISQSLWKYLLSGLEDKIKEISQNMEQKDTGSENRKDMKVRE